MNKTEMNAIRRTSKSLPGQHRPGRKMIEVPDELILEYYNRGNLTHEEIGVMLGLHPKTIGRRLKKMGITAVGRAMNVQQYRESRLDILDEGQRMILVTHLTPEKIKKLEPNEARLMFETLYKASRLEGGKSTENRDVHHHVLESVLKRRLGVCHTSSTQKAS